ncbi:hypothetical protein PANT_3c00052 [Moesziomyces antarcticus T-34]|uniref:Uncharacterized protein n=1 Tax=Pseudozyma antarctica (strain T-34) TaxID=1151754 RepID=M9LSX5_PSEA3|nr:hypothetical protein PANT_3c00052 [Moesziomyces antarcticus T-34]
MSRPDGRWMLVGSSSMQPRHWKAPSEVFVDRRHLTCRHPLPSRLAWECASKATATVVAHPTLLLPLLLPPCMNNPTGRLERQTNNAALYEQPKAEAGGTCASEIAVEVEFGEIGRHRAGLESGAEPGLASIPLIAVPFEIPGAAPLCRCAAVPLRRCAKRSSLHRMTRVTHRVHRAGLVSPTPAAPLRGVAADAIPMLWTGAISVHGARCTAHGGAPRSDRIISKPMPTFARRSRPVGLGRASWPASMERRGPSDWARRALLPSKSGQSCFPAQEGGSREASRAAAAACLV